MAAVDNEKQLSMFDLVKEVLKLNTTLSSKFKDGDYYQFEPKHKNYGSKFTGFPYIWIQVPTTTTDPLVLKRTTTLKDFNVIITLRVEYDARDKFLSYANAIVRQLELPASVSTFQDNGFYNIKIDIVDIDDQMLIEQKTLVQGTFLLSNMGNVER